ncbi:unnamed protein product [Mytilus coruscus]|uniref:SCAN domain-containing protein n=1 Tax=Mytilus coruscus TaxID=42192 RepID=A0A6J8CKV0_MYTCO|nr:unnamed protein product [Mytilus coruscus]
MAAFTIHNVPHQRRLRHFRNKDALSSDLYDEELMARYRFGRRNTKIPKEILLTLEKEEDLLKLQTESLNNQPITENTTENMYIVNASDIPESNSEPNVEPSTSITADETQKDVLKCYVCEKDTSGAHMCSKCDKHIHVICGTTVSEEGYGSKVLCPNCTIDTKRDRHRSGAMDSQLKQANTMIARSKKELGTTEVGQTVAVPIPMFDRGKGDSRNLLGRVIEVNDKGNAVVATRFGQLLGTFGSNEMEICKQNLILEEEINCETILSVCEAATHQSLSGSQGFFKCSYKNDEFKGYLDLAKIESIDTALDLLTDEEFNLNTINNTVKDIGEIFVNATKHTAET